MSESHSESELVIELAEEFIERYRSGEHPPLAEYTSKYPHLKDQIEDIFPAMAMMENIAISDESEEASAESPEKKEPVHPPSIGDFRIVSEVGRGGMGIVYEAEQLSLGRRVALKVLPSSMLPDSKHVRRFEREARSAAKLHHTNIVPVFGVGEQDGMHYYVMQFIQGLPLDDVVAELKKFQAQPTGAMNATASHVHEKWSLHESKRSSKTHSVADVAMSLMTGQFLENDATSDPSQTGEREDVYAATELNPFAESSPTANLSGSLNLSGSVSGSLSLPGASGAHSSAQSKNYSFWQSVANIGHQVADAMHYAHEQGILHRDIKPSNLLLDMKGTTWVTDFGLAKATDQQDITHTGDILGTLRYMPPEAFDGMADARSDIYSLGLTLYELLSFQPAFGEKDRHQLIKQVTSEAAPRLDKVNPEIPRDLVTIIHKAVDRDPTHRYQTAQELSEDLQRFLYDEPIKARRTSYAERLVRWSRRNRSLAISLAVVATLLLIINIAGPIMYLKVVGLNENLQTSKNELSNTVVDLQDTQSELQQTVDNLQATQIALRDERDRANTQAEKMRSLAEKEASSREKESTARAEAERQKLFARRSLYTSSLFAAQQALATSNGYTRAQDLLEELRPQAGESDMRGWEWHFLNAQPDPSGFVLRRFSKFPIAVSFSPDGTQIATGDATGMVKIFDSRTGRMLQKLKGHSLPTWTVVWNPDGTRLASGSNDATARIWDVATGSEIRQLAGHTKRVSHVAWSPDGTQLATVSLDATVRTWDVETGNSLLEMTGHTGEIRGVDWSSDGKTLVSGSRDRTVRTWNAETGERIRILEGHTSDIAGVQFSPDGQRIASAGFVKSEKPVIIWNAQTGEEEVTLECSDGTAWWVQWSPDGEQLATTCWQTGLVEIWDGQTGERQQEFSGYTKSTYQCSWSPDGFRLATASADKTVRIWDIVSEESLPEFPGHKESVRTLAWSHDGTRIASASRDKTVKIWDVATRKELLTFTGHALVAYCVDWSPDGKRLASCGAEQSIQIWEAETGRVLHTIRAADELEMNALAWSPDGTQIATASDDKSVRIFDANTGEELQRFALSGYAISVDWSADGRKLVAGGPGEWKVWDVNGGREIASSSQPSEWFWVTTFSPDGNQIVAGGTVPTGEETFGNIAASQDATLSIWDISTQEEIHRLRGHTGVVRSACWTQEGSRLLTAAQDGRIILWDTETGQQMLVIEGQPSRINFTAQFSPNELLLASAGDEPGIRLWDTTPSHIAEFSPQLLPTLDQRIALTPTIEDLQLRGGILARLGEWDRAAADFDLVSEMGGRDDSDQNWLESPWWVAGPYPSASLEESFPAEEQLDPKLPIANVDGSDAEPDHWRMELLSSDGGLNLGRSFAGAENISGYAQTRIYSPKQQTVGLLVGVDDLAAIWLNGVPVFKSEASTRAVEDDMAVILSLEPGWNTLLAKVVNHDGAHGMFARFTPDPVAIASALDRHQHWDQSVPFWARAVESSPKDAALQIAYGAALLKSGDLESAERLFAKGLELTSTGDDAVLRTIAKAWHDAGTTLQDESSEKAVKCFGQAQVVYEQLLLTENPLDSDAAGLSDVLLTNQQPFWSALRPTEMKSSGGATLTLLDDLSILSSGQHPNTDDYMITVPIDREGIQYFALDVLPDSQFSGERVGRPDSGQAIVTELEIFGTDKSGTQFRIPITEAQSDVTHDGPEGADYYHAMRVIDGMNDQRGWRLHGEKTFQPHRLVVSTDQPVPIETSSLTVKICQNHYNDFHKSGLLLARFRLSATAEPDAFRRESGCLNARSLADPWAKLGCAFSLTEDPDAAARLISRLLKDPQQNEQRIGLIEQAVTNPDLLEALSRLRPDDPQIQLGLGRSLAAQGDWAGAETAFQRAVELSPGVISTWFQTEFWKVEECPLKLKDFHPIEVEPDPFQTVYFESDQADGEGAERTWQSAPVGSDGIVRFVSEEPLCNFLLTRVWSPAEQEVALQMGDDDFLRLFFNDELLLENTVGGGGARVNEHSIVVQLQSGWNSILLKIENVASGSAASLVLSAKTEDLLAGRLTTEMLRASRLAESGDGDEAIILLNDLIQKNPQQDKLYGTRAEIHEKLQQWNLALADWTKADEVAPDKRFRFGNPSAPYLEKRAYLNGRLKRWDDQLVDWTLLLEPERLGENPWILSNRGTTYDKLRDWQRAQVDLDRAVNVALSNKDVGAQRYAYSRRANHYAWQEMWREAAAEFSAFLAKNEDRVPDFWLGRQASLACLMAGDNDLFGKVLAEMKTLLGTPPDPEQARWLLLLATLDPRPLDESDGAELLQLVKVVQNEWYQPRFRAALLYRMGKLLDADLEFRANPDGVEFTYLAAMAAFQIGEIDRAMRLLLTANSAFNSQYQNPGDGGLPADRWWGEWVLHLAMRQQAEELIFESALQDANQILAANPDDADALTNRGNLLTAFDKQAEALPDLNRAIELGTTDAEVYANRGSILLKQGQTESARADLERSMELIPNELAAAPLADLLLKEAKEAINWTILKPTEMKSESGATLEKLDDSSILAGGPNINGDKYRIVIDIPEPMQVSTLRLEALTHESLPGQGPGRKEIGFRGVFSIVGFHVALRTPGSEVLPVVLNRAIVDESHPNRPITVGNWNNAGCHGRPNSAFYDLQTPIDIPVGSQLSFEMQFSTDKAHPKQNLGRFRLAVASDPRAFDIKAALKLADPWERMLAAYRVIDQQAAIVELFKTKPELIRSLTDRQLDENVTKSIIDELSLAITAEPTSPQLFMTRARLYLQTKQYELAKADWLKVIELDPDPNHAYEGFQSTQELEGWADAAEFGWMVIEQDPSETMNWIKLAPVVALAHEGANYSDFCKRMRNQFAESSDPIAVQRLCHACSLISDAVDPEQLPTDRLHTMLTDDTEVPQWFPQWGWSSLALAKYRQGDYEAALKYTVESEKHVNNQYAHAKCLGVIAMANYRLNNHEAAESALRELAEFASGLSYQTNNNQDQLFAKILLQETQTLIQHKEHQN